MAGDPTSDPSDTTPAGPRPPPPDPAALQALVAALPDAAAASALTDFAGAAEPAEREAVAAVLASSAPAPAARNFALVLAKRGDARRRTVAASVLGAYPASDTSARNGLFHLLHQGAASVKLAAADALRRMGGADVAGACLAMVRRAAPPVRDHALAVLVTLVDAQTVEQLGTIADDPENAATGAAVAGALGQIGGPAVRAWALARATHDRWEIRQRAAQALAGQRDPEVMAALLKMLNGDAQPLVRTAAIEILDGAGHDLRAWLLASATSSDALLRNMAAGRLGRHEGDDVDQALFALSWDADGGARWAARHALERRAPERLEALALAHAAHPNEQARAAAVWALGQTHRPEHAPALTALVRDRSLVVRLEAIPALALCDADAGAAQAARLLDDSSWQARQAAAHVLARAPRPEVLPRLLSRLADDDSDVRQAVHAALALIDDDAAAASLGLGLLDDDADVWQAAAGILRRDPLPPAARRLVDAGLDRTQATSSGDDPPSPILFGPALGSAVLRPHTLAQVDVLIASRDADRRALAPKVLAVVDGDEASERLARLCGDHSEEIRAGALRALAARPDPRGWQELLVALADAHKTVRDAAAAIVEHAASFPALARLFELEGESAWRRHRATLDDVLAWGREVGHEFLGEPVEVVALREGAGQTRIHSQGARVPVVEVNPEPIFESQEHGADVVRGVILHELGHHAYDFRQQGFKSANGAAQAEGVGPIFDMLIDERLERRLRAHDADWGELLDRANAHIREAPPVTVSLEGLAKAVEQSAAEVEARVRAGDLPGMVVPAPAAPGGLAIQLPGWSVLTIPGLVPPLHAFFFALLVVRTTRLIIDPVVRRALDLVPANLKDLDHAALASLAVAIGDLLGVRDNGKASQRAWRRALTRHGELLAGLERARRRATSRACEPFHDHEHAPTAPKQRKIVYARQAPQPPRGGPPSRLYNLGAELGFPTLDKDQTVTPDPARHAALASAVRPQSRRLRAHFERLGRRRVDEHAQRRGQRLDLARVRQLAVFGRPDVLVHGREDVTADAYIGLLIDRSGSMAGKEMELAQRFGVMLAEAARGLPGIVGHVNAFDNDTFYRLGDFDRNAIAGLGTGGSNNDAGALLRAAQLANASRRKNRLLVMISDGSPTECSVAALRKLVQVLQMRHGIVCAQVAVDKIQDDAFPHFLDVTGGDDHESVTRFGRLLERLTIGWR